MGLSYLGLSAIGWHAMTESWWNKVIASFLLATIVLGSLYLIYRAVLHFKIYLQKRKKIIIVPTAVLRHVQKMRKRVTSKALVPVIPKQSKSFGAFLGDFANPPTANQSLLLSQWDVIVLNPHARGVHEAVDSCHTRPSQVLGRIDMNSLVASHESSPDEQLLSMVKNLEETMDTCFARGSSGNSTFTGVIVANFVPRVPGSLLDQIVGYINDCGYNVWLEMTYPKFPTTEQCRQITMRAVAGIAIRNGTIRTDGEQQNAHHMAGLRDVQRAVAAQRVSHGPPMVLWETVNDGIEHNYAVTQRAFQWSSYMSMLCWIGSASALLDADVARTHTAGKPLGALMWMKNDHNMKAHNVWRQNDNIVPAEDGTRELFDSLESLVPDMASRLKFVPSNMASSPSQTSLTTLTSLRYSEALKDPRRNALSRSALGSDYTGLGCFQLGLDVNPTQYDDLLDGQRHMKGLNLLKKLDTEEMQGIASKIEAIRGGQGSRTLTPTISMAIDDLIEALQSHPDEKSRLNIYMGLHSGFQTNADVQFWGLYEFEDDRSLDIFVSQFTADRASTVLHTYLASRGCSRAECFLAEFAMADLNGELSTSWHLPQRLVVDIEKLTPTELISLRQRLSVSKDDDSFLFNRIRACCEYQLLDVPSMRQLRDINSEGLLSGKVSGQEVIRSRLEWLLEKGWEHVNPAGAESFIDEVRHSLHRALMECRGDVYANLGKVMQALMKKDSIDAGSDLLALAVFSAFRYYALDEICLEVMDRNIFPNHATDQAAVFSENFGVGSRMDQFFDFTPRTMGRIVSSRYRKYFMRHQPPDRVAGFTELPTAYVAMRVDEDPNASRYGAEKSSALYRVTFLGIFAVPALIDIGLLTTIGRGLYLTTFMTSNQKTFATTALMLALLVCGSVGGWISSGGCYYMYASAFPAMNMFVMTRFVAGVAVGLFGAVVAFISITLTYSAADAAVFVFYFLMLSTYLLTLSAMSIYQIPGSSFLSGRTVIMRCIPILFISPILTIIVQHDIAVYFSILTVFLACLLFGGRDVMSKWVTWYSNVSGTTDAEVLAWYAKNHNTTATEEELKALSLADVPRSAFHSAVLKECNRKFWSPKTKDPLIARLASCFESTRFLMMWYCNHRRSPIALPYSPTWNLTLNAGLENMLNMQKGLRLHSAFLHWRHTGSDIWSAVLYFVVALLDKWASLLTNGGLVGLSAASSERYRLAVGFGLCYYLIGAVSMDYVSQPLWSAANEQINDKITSIESLREVTATNTSTRRKLYWTNLTKFFFLHLWGAAITAAVMWTFDNSRDAMIMYFAYFGAYSGLLFYQFNKIFCGFNAARCLALACVLGLPAGIALHKTVPHWSYSGVSALAFGTWIAGIYSLKVANIGLPDLFGRKSTATALADGKNFVSKPPSYSFSSLEPYPDVSQATLDRSFNVIEALPSDQLFRLKSSEHPGARVVDFLVQRSRAVRSDAMNNAFPLARQIIESTVESWSTGNTVVELVGARYFPHAEPRIRSLAQMVDQQLHVIVAVDSLLNHEGLNADISRQSKVIAEALVRATCEHHLGMSHDHSMLAELLVADDVGELQMAIPESIKQQLETSENDRRNVIAGSDKVLQRHLLLGVDPDIEWDKLPKNIRTFLLDYAAGKSQILSAEEEEWITSRSCATDAFNCHEYIARYHLSASLCPAIVTYARLSNRPRASYGSDSDSIVAESTGFANTTLAFTQASSGPITKAFARFRHGCDTCLKFFILSLVADPEYQRELEYVTRSQPAFIRVPIVLILNTIWVYAKTLQRLILPSVIFYRRETMTQLKSDLKGAKTVLKKNRVIIENFRGPSTCFWSTEEDGHIKLRQYSGKHDKEPEEVKQLIAINTYGDNFRLRQREEYKGEKLLNMFTYEYPTGKNKARLPLQRQCIQGRLSGEVVQYDWRGYVTTGSTFRGTNTANFTFWYRRNAKFEDELLRAEYVLPHITIRIMWCMPPKGRVERLDDWIPFPRVTEATFLEGTDIYHATWTYEHKFHPSISTTLNGESVDTPKMIKEDWFHVLEKPQKLGFHSDNPLANFSSLSTNFVSRTLRLNEKRYPISTSNARTQLWKMWKNGTKLDAITARYMDEELMRSDSSLQAYWRNRNFGFLKNATKYIEEHADLVMARTDLDPDISAWLTVAIQIADLYSFGSGGDTTINTRTHSGQIQDSDDELHVMAFDTSTWPYEPGGVSACRRDLVNDLKTTKWHVVAEMAHDYGIPKFQIERNVKSLTILPLWGLDFMNPTHGVIDKCLDSQVVERSYNTRTSDIREYFLPILKSIVQCSRTRNITMAHLEEATTALVNLNAYFQADRSWNDVWGSDIVKTAWRELWLDESLPDALNVSEWWDFEKPTMRQLDEALNLFSRYLFIFSLPVPEKVPDILQASHHFTGATYGILVKVKRNVTLHVWDHCISFREFTTFMSSAVSYDMPFVNSALQSLGHLACVLLEHHADVVLPCCDWFNPGWEVELGTSQGMIEHRKAFARKIDPVINGICNMESFKPIEEVKTDLPTVVMLSHIQFVKDIKNAIMATDLIVNKWGFKDYRLHIYGNMERAAGLSTECQELIAAKGLSEQCVLKGLGNASVVLQDAWVFLNSSLSEGLPLAMGEAALNGVPVVCTDVGASYCVVTNRKTGEPFSEVVPPNDSESLARAQINILALLGRWAVEAEDEPGFVAPVLSYPSPTPEEVKAISKRMYAKKEQRRKLGMLGRDNVLENFDEFRYLREHEQMLWIGKNRSPNYRAKRRAHVASALRSNVHSSGGSSAGGHNGSHSGAWLGGSVVGSVGEKKSNFGISVLELPKPPSRPRLTPDRWSSAPSSRASSLWKVKETVPW